MEGTRMNLTIIDNKSAEKNLKTNSVHSLSTQMT